MSDERKQVWRVVELAARIAQEDEIAAVQLIRTAAGMVPNPFNNELANALNRIANYLQGFG